MKNLKVLINKHKKCLYEQEITYINNKTWKSSNIYEVNRTDETFKLV